GCPLSRIAAGREVVFDVLDVGHLANQRLGVAHLEVRIDLAGQIDYAVDHLDVHSPGRAEFAMLIHEFTRVLFDLSVGVAILGRALVECGASGQRAGEYDDGRPGEGSYSVHAGSSLHTRHYAASKRSKVRRWHECSRSMSSTRTHSFTLW